MCPLVIVLVRGLQWNRATRIYIDTYITGIDSHGCEDWEDPQSAAYKLESQRFKSVWVWSPENQETNGLSPEQILGGRRRWISQLNREWIHSSAPFFSWGPQWAASCCPHGVGSFALLSSPLKMLISSGISLIETSRNSVLPAIWAPLSPVKLTHKINYNFTTWIIKKSRWSRWEQ